MSDELQNWLERFAERLKSRINAAANEVQQVVDEMSAVELNLQNTFNSFRSLSNTQFVENRVYDEDETGVGSRPETPRRDSYQPSVPTESYENDILPRYRDAVATAWAAFQSSTRQRDDGSQRARSGSNLRNTGQAEAVQILPHIIGTEAFDRDPLCGLGDLRRKHHSSGDSEFGADAGQDGERLAANLNDAGIPSEEEPSVSATDSFDHRDGGLEPAVSAALDFKAMLEAALRNPSLSYDGGTANDPDIPFGEYGAREFSTQNATNDALSDSPRTISTMVDIIGRTMSTKVESKDDNRDSASESSNADFDITTPPLVTSGDQASSLSGMSHPKPSATLIRTSDPNEDDGSSFLPKIEELLKPSFGSSAQAMLNQEFKDYVDKRGDRNQASPSSLERTSSIPQGLPENKKSGKGFPAQQTAILPNSDTRPTVPDGLFQKRPTFDQHTRIESRNSTSADFHKVPSQLSPGVVSRDNRHQDSSSIEGESEGASSDNVQPAASSSPVHDNENLQSASSSSISTFTTSLPLGSLPIRGGLFDSDDDEEDEDQGNLFGAAVPQIESRPNLRTWASQISNSSLFGDIEQDDADPKSASISGNRRARDDVQSKTDISLPISSRVEQQIRKQAEDPHKHHAIDSKRTSPPATDLKVDMPRRPEEIESDSLNRVRKGLQSPIQTMMAAALRSSVSSRVEESDEDSWSGSESGDDIRTQGKTDSVQDNTHESAVEEPEANQSPGGMVIGRFDLRLPVSLNSDPLPYGSASTANAPSGAVHVVDEEDSGILPQQSREEPPVWTPIAVSRSPSAIDASSAVKEATRPGVGLLPQRRRHELSDTDERDSNSGRDLQQGITQSQLVQSEISDNVEPSEHLDPTSSLSVTIVSETSDTSPQIPAEGRLTGDDVVRDSNKDLPASVYGFKRFPSKRAFTPLFDDDDGDDAEDDLFGQVATKPQHGLGRGAERSRIGSSFDTRGGHALQAEGRAVDRGSSLKARLPHSAVSLDDHQSLESLPKSGQKEESRLSATKSGSKLSSLLFGDDDEDENALFGPLGGRTNSKLSKSASLFGDDDDFPGTSRPTTGVRSLFDE